MPKAAWSRNPKLTPEQIRYIFVYESDTGCLRWRYTRSNKSIAGRVAGCLAPNGRRYVSVDCTLYLEHRVAWAWMTGRWPDGEIDHKDCHPDNNAWNNLRLATRRQNQANTTHHKDGLCGLKGVTKHSDGARWRAQIMRNGRQNYLGLFDTPEEAHAAYVSAAKSFWGEFARGE